MDIPFEQLLQAQIGTLAAVMAIGLIVMVVTITLLIGRPVLKLLERMADAAQAAQAKADNSTLKGEQVQAALQTTAAALSVGIEAMTRELKTQTAVLTELGPTIAKQVKEAADSVTARLVTHDEEVKAALARIETTIETMRADISAGHKAQRTEWLGKFDLVLSEIASLRPPLPPNPPPPVALKIETHNELTREDKAA